ncbi:MAG: hypothetical protein CMJ45_04315 [Planctomyces sp.]|nr:hypothetical protein [Planctomyces sp.]
MRKLMVLLGMSLLLLVLACNANDGFSEDVLASKAAAGQDDGGFSRLVEQASAAAPMAAEMEAGPPGAPGAFASDMQVLTKVESESSQGSSQELEAAERKVISTAFMTIEVALVDAATTQVRDIAENLGGFLENLNSSGVDEGQQANMTVRVPQAQFSSAVEQIELVGKVQSKNLGSEDVSERFIDLQARLKSSLREEESLLSLLGRTSTVSEVLTIERELTRVRSDIERFQGQLNFLERRIDLATITASLTSLHRSSGQPPSASLKIEVNGVKDHVEAVKALVASSDGVVDAVLVSLREGKESAVMTVHVFSDDFDTTIDFLEGQGKVRSKDLEEGKPADDGANDPEEKPRARIDLSFVQDTNSVNIGLMVAIAAPIGALALG